MPKKNVRVWAKIAPKVLRAKTYRGYPSNRNEELELDHAEVARMRPRIIGRPLRYNHDEKTSMGVVVDDRIAADGSWDVLMDLDDETPEGAETIRFVEAGKLRGVSLKHRPDECEPIEVSVCVEGARHGSGIYWDTNTQTYTSTRDPNHAIAASDAESGTAADAESLLFLPVVSASMPADTPMPDAEAATTPPVEEEKKGPEEEARIEQCDAELDEEAELLSKFPTVKAVTELLKVDQNTIPTAAEKEAIQEKVAELEHTNLQQAAELEKLRAENAQHKSEKERIAAEKAHAERIADDFSDALALSKEERAVLASASPAVQKVVAKVSKQKRTLLYASARKKMAQLTQALAAPADQALNEDIYSRSADMHHRYVQQPTQRAPVEASRSSLPASFQPGSVQWGQPMTRIPTGVVREIAASKRPGAPRMDEHKAQEQEQAQAMFEPGCGLNWKWRDLESPQQAMVFLQGPRTTAQIHNAVSFSELGFSGDWQRALREQHRAQQKYAPQFAPGPAAFLV